MKKKIFSIIILTVLTLCFFIVNAINEFETKMFYNIKLEDISLRLKSKDEINNIIKDIVNKKNSQEVIISIGEKKEYFTLHELGFNYVTNFSGELLFERQCKLNLFQKIKLYYINEKETAYKLTYETNHELLDLAVLKIEDYDSSKKPVDATLRVTSDNQVIIEKEIYGQELDKEELINKIIKEVNLNNFSFDAPYRNIPPQKTSQDIRDMGIKEIIGSYETTFNEEERNRVENIKLATEAINGVILAPDEEFDYNKVVGERTIERGYKTAHVFVNGEIEEGIGGGICQVSTTLYNVVLYSNLEVLERRNHSLPVSYVPLGRDATVSYGYINFRFKNTTENYIYIKGEVIGNKLSIKIFGTDEGFNVSLYSKVLNTVNPTTKYIEDRNIIEGNSIIESGGSNGYVVETYKVVKQNDKIIYDKKITKDFYKSRDRIIRIPYKEKNTQ